MRNMQDHMRKPKKEGGKPGRKKRILKLCATAAGTAAAVLIIWKLPAAQAEKNLKDIDWR